MLKGSGGLQFWTLPFRGVSRNFLSEDFDIFWMNEKI